MTPQTLARPLAARVAGLPEPEDREANPPLSPAVARAAEAALAAGHTHYTDRPGVLPLRRRVVETLGRRCAIELSADEVTITCGSTEARFVALKQLARRGTTIACAASSPSVAAVARLIEVDCTAYPDQSDPVSVVYLTPADEPDRIQALLELAARAEAWIIWDMSVDAAENCFHPAQNPGLAPRTVTIGSFSAFLPGWRVGWMAGSQMANKLRAFKQSVTICSTSVSQWAALGLEEEA